MRWPWFDRHPTPAALVDVLEGHGARTVQRHLKGCQVCADRLAAAVAAHDQVRRETVPEPPVVFWTQLSAGIAAEVLEQGRPARVAVSRWRGRLVPVGAAAATVALLVLVGVVWHAPAPPAAPEPRVAAVEPADAVSGSGSTDSEAGAPDGSWAVVLALAEEVDLADASAIGLGPALGSFDEATAWLSEDERSELVRLIREELGGVE